MENKDLIGNIEGIFKSEDFKSELSELSSYATNIKQETLFHYLLAKYLNRSGSTVTLEKKQKEEYKNPWCHRPDRKRKQMPRNDLVVDDASIEMKFNFECDLKGCEKELEDHDNNIQKALDCLKGKINGKKNIGWKCSLPILKDIFCKEPDVFIWIIQASDLSKLIQSEEEYLDKICWAKERFNYQRKYKFNDENTLKVAERLLEMIKKKKSITDRKLKLKTKKSKSPQMHNNSLYFPNIYHIHIWDFRNLDAK